MPPTSAKPKPNVFDFEDYRLYVREALDAERQVQRGAQARLAERLGCQSAYLSMVLGGKADLSLEQAATASEHFHHGEPERHYFLLLVQRSRAGSVRLQRYFDAQLAAVRHERTILSRRLTGTSTLAPEHQAVFYGAWYHRAIHIALTVPTLQTREAIQRYLGLPMEVVNRSLELLVTAGLATREGERFVVGPTRLHLDQASPYAAMSHAQARIRTLTALSMPPPDAFHYSSIVSGSARDLPRLREIMMRAIEEMRAVVRDSPEEDVFCYGLDLFSLRT